MKKLNYTEDLLRVIFFWIGIFFLVSGVLSFLGILKPAVNSGIQNPDMLGTTSTINRKWYKSEGLGRKSIFTKIHKI